MSTASTLRRIIAAPEIWVRFPDGLIASFSFASFDRRADYIDAMAQDGATFDLWPVDPRSYCEAIQVDATGSRVVPGAEVEPWGEILDDAHTFEHVAPARGEWRDLYRVRYAGTETYYLAR